MSLCKIADDLSERLTDTGLEPGAPAEKTIDIAAPAQRVWRTISKAGNLTCYHPFCEFNPVEKWPGVGARDTVVYYSALVYQRDFRDAHEHVDVAVIDNASTSVKFLDRIKPMK